MKKKTLFLFTLGILLLAACSSEVYDRSFTASGDGQREQDLAKDEQFSPTDDLNVVIKLNRHDDPASIVARFIDPNGDELELIQAEAPNTVGTVTMGIDFDARADSINQWVSGRYQVELTINDELVDTFGYGSLHIFKLTAGVELNQPLFGGRKLMGLARL